MPDGESFLGDWPTAPAKQGKFALRPKKARKLERLLVQEELWTEWQE